MKSVIFETKPKQTSKYPCLQISKSSDLVVLFHAPSRGVVIAKNAVYDVGLYVTSWEESTFVPFHGTVTISED